MPRALASALVFSCLLPAGAFAQAYSDPGVGTGVHLSVTRGRPGATRLSGGAQVRARLTGAIAVEGLVAVRHEVQAVGGEDVLSLLTVPVQVSAMLFFLYRGPVQPYLLGGIGYYYVHARGEGSNASYGSHSESKFGFHGGLGVEARLAPRISLAADVRYVSLDVDALTKLGEKYGVDRRGDFFQGSVGVLVSF